MLWTKSPYCIRVDGIIVYYVLLNYLIMYYNGLGLFLSGVPTWRLMQEVLYLTPMIAPKRFGILEEGLDAFFRHYCCVSLLL